MAKDKTPPSEVTLDSYVKTVTDVLDSQPEPVILVGHSIGGIIISQAAENRPDKVRSLVYICAFLLPSGGSFMKATAGVKGSMVLDNLVMGDDQTSVMIKEEVMREAFAHDVPAEAFSSVRPRIVPEPTAPLGGTISVTEERWGRIPRYYVECTGQRHPSRCAEGDVYGYTGQQGVFDEDESRTELLSTRRVGWIFTNRSDRGEASGYPVRHSVTAGIVGCRIPFVCSRGITGKGLLQHIHDQLRTIWPRPVNALCRNLEVSLSGFVNIHELLRIAIYQREPGALNLHHYLMAPEE